VLNKGLAGEILVILNTDLNMEILLVAATFNEVKPYAGKLGLSMDKPVRIDDEKNLSLLITGVGMVNTTYHLTKALCEKKYDRVINAGICGAFDRSIQIGELVEITEDRFSELGAEDRDNFLTVAELSLADPNEHPFIDERLKVKALKNEFKAVRSITVNKVHGSETSIRKTEQRFSPQVESMEGAAVIFCCMKENVPVNQFRAVSNYVEPRNRNAWNIPLALNNLQIFLDTFIQEIK
jgi:futalosine hydrolase